MKDDFPRLEVSESLRRRMVDVARQFRKEPTKSEALLWQALRGKKHEYQKQADQERQAILEMLGLNILRIKAELVESDLRAALDMIRGKIRKLEPKRVISPSPTSGEGKGGGR